MMIALGWYSEIKPDAINQLYSKLNDLCTASSTANDF